MWTLFHPEDLISNSIKFTQKGSITVSINYSGEDKFLSTCIDDTGIGMSSQALKQVQSLTNKIDLIQNDEY